MESIKRVNFFKSSFWLGKFGDAEDQMKLKVVGGQIEPNSNCGPWGPLQPPSVFLFHFQ